MERVEVENQYEEISLNPEAIEIGKSEICCHPSIFKLVSFFLPQTLTELILEMALLIIEL